MIFNRTKGEAPALRRFHPRTHAETNQPNWHNRRWIKDIEAYTPKSVVSFPIIADPDRHIATL